MWYKKHQVTVLLLLMARSDIYIFNSEYEIGLDNSDGYTDFCLSAVG